jgi:DNA-binding winged helix-turn-helix (wHTH) protein
MRESSETSASVTVHPSAGSVLSFGPFRFDRNNQILWRDDAEVKLPPRALAILDMLLERTGSVVSKRALLDNVWKETNVTETSLTEAVSLLRQALGDDPQRPTYILTAHRRGYRFVAPVSVSGPHRSRSSPTAQATPEEQPVVSGRDSSVTTAHTERRPGRRMAPALALWTVPVAALLGALLAFWWSQPRQPAQSAPVRVSFATPNGVSLAPFLPSLTLDPTGCMVVFVGVTEPDTTQLFLRRLDSFELSPIPGTEGAHSPFFSPDGAEIGFVAGGQLVRIPIEGGVGVPLCRMAKGFGAAWGRDGTIVFSGASGGLSRVPAGGGEVEPLTHPQPTAGEIGHWWPEILPDGDTVVYTIWSTTLTTAKLAALSLATGESRVILEGASHARHIPSGHLVFATAEGILASRFDSTGLELTGPLLEISDQAVFHPMIGLVQMAVAGNGTMAHLPTVATGNVRELVLLDSSGTERALAIGPFLFRNMDLDRAGRQMAVTVLDGIRSDVWISPLAEPSLSRFTFAGFNIEPRWTPDGASVTFASNRDGPFNIYQKPAAGGGTVERMMISDLHQYPQAWSPDGRILLYAEAHPVTGYDLWLLNAGEADHPRTPFLCTPDNEVLATLSPDGRWLAYQADDTGAWEVYVRSFPDGDGPWQVSERGGLQPFWSSDGTRLYYWDYPRLIVQKVDAGTGLALGSRQTLMSRQDLEKICPLPMGHRFLAIREMEQDPKLTEIRVVLGWSTELEPTQEAPAIQR